MAVIVGGEKGCFSTSIVPNDSNIHPSVRLERIGRAQQRKWQRGPVLISFFWRQKWIPRRTRAKNNSRPPTVGRATKDLFPSHTTAIVKRVATDTLSTSVTFSFQPFWERCTAARPAIVCLCNRRNVMFSSRTLKADLKGCISLSLSSQYISPLPCLN